MPFNLLNGPSGPTFGAPNTAGGGTAPTITSPSFLVAGTQNTVYPTTTFTATGTAPITWSIFSGTLPAGMTFVGGVLAGTPTATFSGSITFRATNAFGFADRPLTLTVNASASNYPTLTSGIIPDASVNAAYTYTFTHTNSPTVFSLITPDIVLGTLTSGPLGYTHMVGMTSDGSGYSAGTTATFSAAPAGGITATGYPYVVGGAIKGIVITDPGKGYLSPPTITLGSTGGGVGAVFAAVRMGSAYNGVFPSNISLNRSTGVFSGTETATGFFQFGVMACNSVGNYIGAWGFNVSVVPPYIIEDDLFFAVVGDAFTQTLTTTGATPVTWSSSGALPSGLTFNTSTGTISGTASAPATTTFTATATNAGGASSKDFYVVAYAKTSSRVHPSDLTYVGSFRLPDSAYLTYAGSSGRGSGITLSNKTGAFGNGTMYVAGNDVSGTILPVCEVNIPALVNGYSAGSVSGLNTATIAQNWVDAIEGNIASISPEASAICSMLWSGSKLYISAGYFYDQTGSGYKTFTRPDNLSTTGGIVGPAGITDGVNSSFRNYMGYLTQVPSAAQSAYSISSMLIGGFVGSLGVLGGTGPNSLVFNPASLTGTSTITGTKVLSYPFISGTDWSKSVTHLFGSPYTAHLTPNLQQNKWFNSYNTQYNGAAWVSSTNKKSFLAFARTSIGKSWYGSYQRNQAGGYSVTTGGAFNEGDSLETKPGIVFDPVNTGNKGGHGYPYALTVTAYDESELGAVVAGSKNSWEAKPYDTWKVPFPFEPAGGMSMYLQGVAHDEANRRIYVSVPNLDPVSAFSSIPIVHVYSYPA
jgi:hypothetical protein